jgi:hypothetical protein
MRRNKESVHLVGGAASSTDSRGFRSAGRVECVCVGGGGVKAEERRGGERKEGGEGIGRGSVMSMPPSTWGELV